MRYFGRDVFSRIVYGARLTLQIGVIAVGISLTSGLLLGLFAGYASGWAERILMRLVDVLFSFTEIVIALACLAILGIGLTNAMIAIGIASIPFYARVTHSVVLVEKNKPYFEAAQSGGAGHLRLIFSHLLPNVIPTLIVVGTLGISTAVLAAADLSDPVVVGHRDVGGTAAARTVASGARSSPVTATISTSLGASPWAMRLFSGRISTRTCATPCPLNPSSSAARRETSMIRPLAKGPRSFTLSSRARPFSRLVTRTTLGSGRVV